MHTGTHHPSGFLRFVQGLATASVCEWKRGGGGSMGAGSGERPLGTPGLEARPWRAKGYEIDVGISNTAFETATPVLTFL